MSSNNRSLSLLLLVAGFVVVQIHGFAFVPHHNSKATTTTTTTTTTTWNHHELKSSPRPSIIMKTTTTTTRLYASEEETKEQETKEEEEEETKKEEESPEMIAMKKEIAELEAKLEVKRQEESSLVNDVEKYTKEGYVRRVAELDSVRRLTSEMQSSSKESNMAMVLKEFLPVLDDLNAKHEKNKENEFGQKYNAVSIQDEWNKMGVTTLVCPKEGTKADPIQVHATSEEYSDTIEKGCIIKPGTDGLELKGHVIRQATAIVSLGKEEKEEEKKDEEDAPADEEKKEE